jgi:hypothetical protein
MKDKEKVGIKKDEYGKTILDYAMKYENAELLVYCINKGLINKTEIRIYKDYGKHTYSISYSDRFTGSRVASEVINLDFRPYLLDVVVKDKGKDKNIKNDIYRILVKNNFFNELNELHFFSNLILRGFNQENLIYIFSEATKDIEKYISNLPVAINAYFVNLIKNKKEKKILHYINQSNSEIDKNKVEKSSGDIVVKTIKRFPSKLDHDASLELLNIIYPSGVLRLDANLSIDIINNFSYETAKKYINLTRPSLNENIINAISIRKYQNLYDFFKKEEILKHNEHIIKVGDVDILNKYIDIISFDIDSLIKNKNYDMAVKVFKKRKEYIDTFDNETTLKVMRWISDKKKPLVKADIKLLEIYNKICQQEHVIKISDSGIPHGDYREILSGVRKGLIRDDPNKYKFDFFPAKFSVGLVIGSCNYKFTKEFIEMLPDYIKDDILTKYIDGDLNVIKGLIDAGACYICNSVETVSDERNFNPERYYEKRDMSRTNLTKLWLDNLHKV